MIEEFGWLYNDYSLDFDIVNQYRLTVSKNTIIYFMSILKNMYTFKISITP